MTTTSWMFASLAVLVMACSSSQSGSGVATGKKLVDLSASERGQLCAYSVDVEGGPRTVDCGNHVTITIEDDAACVSDLGALGAQCQATVGDAEGCFEAIGSNPCSLGASACAAVLSCAAAAGAR